MWYYNMEPVVSVIITNYNYEKYLMEAIESVLNQTYQKLELIIVDDGSTDNSFKILDTYEKRFPLKIRVVRKENGGQGSAFNMGMELANGEIIAFLDADDYWYPTKLETIIPYHINFDCVQHNLLVNGERKYTFLEHNSATIREGFIRYGFTGAIPTSGLSFDRKKLLEDVYPIPESEYRLCADSYIRGFFLINNSACTIDRDLAFYRSHENNGYYKDRKKYAKVGDKSVNNAYSKYKGESNLQVGQEYVTANRMYESLKVDQADQDRYIIYGNGYAGNHFFERLRSSHQVVAFASTYRTEESFNALPLWGVKELKEHEDKYDKILIASQQMVEIYDYLLEQGFAETKIIHPQM